jgi:hypothetical protein
MTAWPYFAFYDSISSDKNSLSEEKIEVMATKTIRSA